jgi:hypothetical protein
MQNDMQYEAESHTVWVLICIKTIQNIILNVSKEIILKHKFPTGETYIRNGESNIVGELGSSNFNDNTHDKYSKCW